FFINVLKTQKINMIKKLQIDEIVYSDNLTPFLLECKQIILSKIAHSNFMVEEIAHTLGKSHSSLYKKIKGIANISVNEFVRRVRLEKASEMLISGDYNVNEAAYAVGFNNVKYFREQFKKIYGRTPNDYKKTYLNNVHPRGEYLMKWNHEYYKTDTN